MGFIPLTRAGNPQRIGHTQLNFGHTNDSGLYAATIDVTNGYGYFIGDYLYKVDLTTNLPVAVGAPLVAQHALHCGMDVAAGQLYVGRAALDRFAVNGTNAVTANGSLTLAAGGAVEILIDDADPALTNHYGYVLCTSSGNPAVVVKVALAAFTNVSAVTLTGQTNFLFAGAADVKNGYGYFVSSPASTSSVPYLVKIKFTPGTNAPVRVGTTSFGVVGEFVDGGCVDTVHGYAYYGTYGNVGGTARVYKLKLEAGDAAPTVVGAVDLKSGEGRLAAAFCDPTNNFVYFADDNTYPGNLYQFGMNGTNPPVEIGPYPMLGTTNAHPANGTTAANTNDAYGNLLYGEVFFRSAVFDPVRGFAYLGQDSRPNQVVKVQVAKPDAFALTGAQKTNGGFQFAFTNISGGTFSVLRSTNIALAGSNWISLGTVTDNPAGQFHFTDASATNGGARFYRVSSP